MPKKRTVKPFYGKREQRMEMMARHAGARGDHDQAAEFMNASRASTNVKMMRHARTIANRPIGKFIKIPRQVLSFMRSYGRGR